MRMATPFLFCAALWLCQLGGQRWTSSSTSVGFASAQAIVDQQIGGEPIEPNEYKSFAAIRFIDGGIFTCGGVLVGSRHVLTALHCFGSHHFSMFHVELGYLCTARDNCGRENEIIGIRHVFPSFAGDMAIVILHEQVTIDIQPALPYLGPSLNRKQPEFAKNLPLTLVSAGRDSSGALSPQVQKLRLRSLSRNRCDALNANLRQEASSICSISREGNPCRGDSGSPLFVKGKGKWKQRDVVMAIHLRGPLDCSEPKGVPVEHLLLSDQTASFDIEEAICKGDDSEKEDWCAILAPPNTGDSTTNKPKKVKLPRVPDCPSTNLVSQEVLANGLVVGEKDLHNIPISLNRYESAIFTVDVLDQRRRRTNIGGLSYYYEVRLLDSFENEVSFKAPNAEASTVSIAANGQNSPCGNPTNLQIVGIEGSGRVDVSVFLLQRDGWNEAPTRFSEASEVGSDETTSEWCGSINVVRGIQNCAESNTPKWKVWLNPKDKLQFRGEFRTRTDVSAAAKISLRAYRATPGDEDFTKVFELSEPGLSSKVAKFTNKGEASWFFLELVASVRHVENYAVAFNVARSSKT